MTDSLVYTKFCAVLQKSRAKDDKISISDMTVDTQFLFTAKLVRERTNSFQYVENNIFKFFLYREVKSTETNNVNDADHYLAKNCQQSEPGMAEQCARKSDENSESRCSTNW